MRWILLILLLANGVFFSYQWYLNSRVVDYQPDKPVLSQSAGEQLLLLSEERQLQRKPRQKELSKPEDSSVVSSKMCVYLGPFQAKESAEALHQRLLALSVQGRVDPVKVAGEPDYWVYMKPLISREEALRQLKELQRQKIDSFVVTQGEMKNGISLGLFTKKASADRVLARMNKSGYDAEVKLIERFRDEFWVTVTDAEARQVGDDVWEKVAQDYQFIEKEQNLCKAVASPP
ncbi:SPOR domain-containing protein [Aestuariirhabdus sp. Z084]|uniref:SPOR domain-containing protein n=1 Tax=Aestuariirhabdus haliotis TaxID=2918751 RepID=UPI00201B3FD3|nr:SPOR domain-containing protein [Aestuariirhabdus haliotis]MCL6417801.1 SPOR domain-containing protein [Aestuariirhabdus haliotis]MCL6421726.1 SPOR domain-containing protein [Aestuariirhabdus haliotis]